MVKVLNSLLGIYLGSQAGLVGGDIQSQSGYVTAQFLGLPGAWCSASPSAELPGARRPRLCPRKVHSKWSLFASMSSHKCHSSRWTWWLPTVPWVTPKCLSVYKRKVELCLKLGKITPSQHLNTSYGSDSMYFNFYNNLEGIILSSTSLMKKLRLSDLPNFSSEVGLREVCLSSWSMLSCWQEV